jgi:hypothetical protein
MIYFKKKKKKKWRCKKKKDYIKDKKIKYTKFLVYNQKKKNWINWIWVLWPK